VIRIIAKSQVDQQLASALVESDRRYFEMAARTQRLAIGQLCWMPGLHELAASCVIHRIVSDRIANPMESWLDDIEAILSERLVFTLTTLLPRSKISFSGMDMKLDASSGFWLPKERPNHHETFNCDRFFPTQTGT